MPLQFLQYKVVVAAFSNSNKNSICKTENTMLKLIQQCRLAAVVSILFVVIPSSSSWSPVSNPKTMPGLNACNGIATTTRTSAILNMNNNDDEIPSMDWLTDTLKESRGNDDDDDDDNFNNNNNTGKAPSSPNRYSDENMSDLSTSPYLEEHSIDGDLGDVPIPTTGVSVSDEMEKAQKDRFYTQLVPITGLGKGVKAVRILSSTTAGSYEAVRYLVRLTRNNDEADPGLLDALDLGSIDLGDDDDDDDDDAGKSSETATDDFVMVDVPPFSAKLVGEMKSLMGPNGRLSAILVTNQECIHYDESPGVFSVRKADLAKWKRAFPDTETVAYRMDIPRDCRDSITQRLDGYGPWAMQDVAPGETTGTIFEESGLPFTVKEWDPEIAEDIMSGKIQPPGEEAAGNNNDDGTVIELDANGGYPPDAIRANEEGKRVIAVYTPGRTFGSMVYVFPELQLCASGYSLPLEDSREEENHGMDSPGPALDHRGYITTSRGGMSRQIESARNLVNTYSDRFDVVLTARGDPFYLDGTANDRRQTMLEIMGQYEKLGQIYEQLGISGN